MQITFTHINGFKTQASSLKEIVRNLLTEDLYLDADTNREELWAWLDERYTSRYNALQNDFSEEVVYKDRLLEDISRAYELV